VGLLTKWGEGEKRDELDKPGQVVEGRKKRYRTNPLKNGSKSTVGNKRKSESNQQKTGHQTKQVFVGKVKKIGGGGGSGQRKQVHKWLKLQGANKHSQKQMHKLKQRRKDQPGGGPC